MITLDHFREIWLLDFEFQQPDGERPLPICLVAHELRTDRWLRLAGDELVGQPCPFDTDSGSLFVAYLASAELGCFLQLGWPLPVWVLDMYVEFRNLTNGITQPVRNDLLGALFHFGLDAIPAVEKQEMRDLAIRGGPYTAGELSALLSYCESDVQALISLWPRMIPRISLPHALRRGEYMATVTEMEHTGVPIDTPIWGRLKEHWGEFRQRLIDETDHDYGVYDGGVFKSDRFAAYVATQQIPWPRLTSGALCQKAETFSDMSKVYPHIQDLHQLRKTLAQMREPKLAIGSDGRNRCLLSPFRAITGRNQPSTSRFIFGAPAWMRSLIRPEPGRAIAYIDYTQQEFAIAAALSQDPAMLAAYASGDVYMAFAVQAGAVPPGATKATHAHVREKFKQCVLGVQYGMGAETLAGRIRGSISEAKALLNRHRRTYPVYWEWQDRVINTALLTSGLQTAFDWRLDTVRSVNLRSLGNWPMQAHGAEMLRQACCRLMRVGITVCAPVHDALLIESDANEVDEIVAQTRKEMGIASREILGNVEVRTDAKVVVAPDRFVDERGVRMWARVMRFLEESAYCPDLSRNVTGPCHTV